MNSWTDGVSTGDGETSYGESPYYNCPDGWKVLADADWAADYEFSTVVVWRNEESGELRAAYDAGCSCPTPFANLTLDCARLIKSVRDLRPLTNTAMEYNSEEASWDKPDDKLAELKARVHRALRDAPRFCLCGVVIENDADYCCEACLQDLVA